MLFINKYVNIVLIETAVIGFMYVLNGSILLFKLFAYLKCNTKEIR